MAERTTHDSHDREKDILIAIAAVVIVGAPGATWFFWF